MKSLLLILLALSFVVNGQDINIVVEVPDQKPEELPFDEFLNYLYESGLYEILAQINREIGSKVSCLFCEELLFNKHCEQIIKIGPINYIISIDEPSVVFDHLNEILLFREENVQILKQNNFDEETLKKIILRIEKRLSE